MLKRKIHSKADEILNTNNAVSKWWDARLHHCNKSYRDEFFGYVYQVGFWLLVAYNFAHTDVCGKLTWFGVWCLLPIVHICYVAHKRGRQ